jgi:hypothetical protein
MDRRMNAAVVEGLVIPQETCVCIEAASSDEAHYLCALLNSDPIDSLVQSLSVAGGKGFGSPGILEFLPLRKYDPSNAAHRALAARSRKRSQPGMVPFPGTAGVSGGPAASLHRR